MSRFITRNPNTQNAVALVRLAGIAVVDVTVGVMDSLRHTCAHLKRAGEKLAGLLGLSKRRLMPAYAPSALLQRLAASAGRRSWPAWASEGTQPVR